MYHERVSVEESDEESAEQRPPGRVLVVEDDRITREFVAGLLRGAGFDVQTLDTGAPAVDMARNGKVDLVLLDVVMPGVNGIDVCRMIKSVTGEAFVPVILVTADRSPSLREQAAGMEVDILTKPLKPASLRAAMGRKHGRREAAE